jgi:midasin
VTKIVKLYQDLKALSVGGGLTDSNQQRPHFSLRTLCRSLEAFRIFRAGGRRLEISLFEGFCASFSTQLDCDSQAKIEKKMWKALGGTVERKDCSKPPHRPGGRGASNNDFVLLGPYWVPAGPLPPVDDAAVDKVTNRKKFVKTKTVTINLLKLGRAIVIGKYPILLQVEKWKAITATLEQQVFEILLFGTIIHHF